MDKAFWHKKWIVWQLHRAGKQERSAETALDQIATGDCTPVCELGFCEVLLVGVAGICSISLALLFAPWWTPPLFGVAAMLLTAKLVLGARFVTRNGQQRKRRHAVKRQEALCSAVRRTALIRPALTIPRGVDRRSGSVPAGRDDLSGHGFTGVRASPAYIGNRVAAVIVTLVIGVGLSRIQLNRSSANPPHRLAPYTTEVRNTYADSHSPAANLTDGHTGRGEISKPFVRSHRDQATQETSRTRTYTPSAGARANYVNYSRSASSRMSHRGTVYVRGYYRKNGTYVRPHTRRRPRS